MNFAYLILYVDDVPATLQAWETAFGLERSYLHDDGIYAELSTGSTTLSLAETGFGRDHFQDPDVRAMFDRPPSRHEVGFVTDDVPAAFQRAVDQGMRPVAGPLEKPWGQVVAWVRDANGILIELASPMS